MPFYLINIKEPFYKHPISAFIWLLRPRKTRKRKPLKGMVECPHCNGFDYDIHMRYFHCSYCVGKGSVSQSKYDEYYSREYFTCSECKGKGQYWQGNEDGTTSWCQTCHGTGKLPPEKVKEMVIEENKYYQHALFGAYVEIILTLLIYIVIIGSTTFVSIYMGKHEGLIAAIFAILAMLISFLLLGIAIVLFILLAKR